MILTNFAKDVKLKELIQTKTKLGSIKNDVMLANLAIVMKLKELTKPITKLSNTRHGEK